jgi:hypothetical protein
MSHPQTVDRGLFLLCIPPYTVRNRRLRGGPGGDQRAW